MKYKEGDRVRIKSLDWYNENKSERGFICFDYANFIPEMSRYCGEILTINRVVEEFEHYLVLECAFSWTDEMIEGLVEEEIANYSKVIDNGVSNPIIAKTSSATIDTDKGFYSYSDSDGNLEMEWNLPEGYQFVAENGNVINAKKIVLEKKKKEYPKTYAECCKVLGIDEYDLVQDYRVGKIRNIQSERIEKLNILNKLLICRDAYWKIAGDEMGLGKPWEPDWEDYEQKKFVFVVEGHTLIKREYSIQSCILAFPILEMRDAFYENFKELIESCKELL